MRKSRKTKNGFYRVLSIALVISSALFLILLLYMDLLPAKYFRTILIAVLVFDLFNVLLIGYKRLKKKTKKFLSFFMTLGILLFSVANYYSIKTLGILSFNGNTKYKTGNYSVIVLKDSKYKKLSDIKGKEIGFFENSEGIEPAKKRIAKEVEIKFKSYTSSSELVEDLLRTNIEVIVLEDSVKRIIDEENLNFKKSTKVIYTFKVKTTSSTSAKEVNVTEKPFVIYISGIDTYGEIASVSRSDVNMIMVVNPNTHQVLLVSMPRDYYVKLHGTKGYNDKLTHAGIYGMDTSIKTIEDLLDIDINYYIKVNFTSVIDIVDALDGLDVYSEYTFISYSGYSFKEGMNYVNGKQALDFARTRHAFREGDRQRGKNQQAVIEALIRKMSSKSIITKYNSLLNAINGKYQTNIGMKKITSLIKLQLNDMPKWIVTSYSLKGYDSKEYTYTYNGKLYVMIPNENSINEAKQLINDVLNDKELESSYTGVGGGSSRVTKPYNSENEYYDSLMQTPKSEVVEEDDDEKNVQEEEETSDVNKAVASEETAPDDTKVETEEKDEINEQL